MISDPKSKLYTIFLEFDYLCNFIRSIYVTLREKITKMGSSSTTLRFRLGPNGVYQYDHEIDALEQACQCRIPVRFFFQNNKQNPTKHVDATGRRRTSTEERKRSLVTEFQSIT